MLFEDNRFPKSNIHLRELEVEKKGHFRDCILNVACCTEK